MFVKVDKDIIVNTDHIIVFEKSYDNKWSVYTVDGSSYEVVPEYLDDFKKSLKDVNDSIKRLAFGNFN